MTSSDYSKHKDRDPRATVRTIKDTLASIGITTECVWTSHQFEGTCSNRVTIAGTSLGTNGKGTSEDYALASGYSELMERIQNKAIGKRAHITETYERLGFYEHPDERMVTAREIVARHDPVTDGWLEGWGCGDDEEKVSLVEELSRSHYRHDLDMIPEVPFADLTTGEIRWLSPALYYRLCGSNGMSAGNTLEECLVQGLSEIFERHVRLKVLSGEVVMPEIPHEDLRAWSVGRLIDQIEEDGRYQVHVFDGSLGKGYPVAVTAIVDRIESTFGVNCGAHPSLAVAVERTLTEAFQGRTLNMFCGINWLASKDESMRRGNRRIVLRNDYGAYPPSLFVGTPSWEYRRWESDEDLSNADLLRRLVGLLRRDGYRLLVRDAAHLGFTSCQIIIPGMSEVSKATPRGLEAIRVMRRFDEAFNRFPDITPEQVEDILGAEAFTDMPKILAPTRPLRGFRMDSQRIYGYLHLSRGEFAEAESCFRTHVEVAKGPVRIYWRALADYARWRGLGTSHADALELVRSFYPPAFYRRLEREMAGGDGLLTAQFPHMNCYHCETCEAAAAGSCLGLADRNAFAKIDAALAKTTVSQEKLLARLQGILAG